MILKVKIAKDFKGSPPSYQTEGSSGFDVTAQIDNEIILLPNVRLLIPTKLFFEIPKGYELQVRSRSGLTLRNGLIVANSPGTIDSDYRGEVQVIITNISNKAVIIKPLDRIAQLVLCPVIKVELEIVESLSESERDNNGFGSTGLS